MKRIFCVITVMICLVTAGATAERHIGLQGSFPACPDSTDFSFDLYESEGKQTILSPLFSEYAAVWEDDAASVGTELFSRLFSVRAGSVSRAYTMFEKILKEWIEMHQADTKTGFYAGDLFLSASTESACTFRLSEIQQYLEEKASGSAEDAGAGKLLCAASAFAAQTLQQATDCDDPVISLRNYDRGNYYTVLIGSEETAMISVSADLSENTRKWLITVRDDALYSHRLICCTAKTETFILHNALYFSSASAFPGESDTPACSGDLEVYQDAETGTAFRYEFLAGSLDNPLEVSGRIVTMDENTGEMTAAIRISGKDEDTLLISAVLDGEIPAEAEDGLTEMDMKNESDRGMVRLTLYTAELQLAMEIMQAVPADLQQVIWNLITIQ